MMSFHNTTASTTCFLLLLLSTSAFLSVTASAPASETNHKPVSRSLRGGNAASPPASKIPSPSPSRTLHRILSGFSDWIGGVKEVIQAGADWVDDKLDEWADDCESKGSLGVVSADILDGVDYVFDKTTVAPITGTLGELETLTDDDSSTSDKNKAAMGVVGDLQDVQNQGKAMHDAPGSDAEDDFVDYMLGNTDDSSDDSTTE